MVRTPGTSSSSSLTSRRITTPKGGITPSSSSITDNLLSVSFPSPLGIVKGAKTPTPRRTNDKVEKDDKKRPTAGDFF